MKILRIILIVIVVVIAIPLVIALFVNRDYGVERTVVIDRPVQEVFDFVKLLRNQDLYSKWAEMDPNMEQSFSGTDGTVGFISAWKGNENVGEGEQEITGITEGYRINTQLRFIKPFKSQSDAYMVTESQGDNQTLVTWGFSGRMNYPLNLFFLIMDMDESIGADYDYGLQKLKDLLEADGEYVY
jgi:hypothetical protein